MNSNYSKLFVAIGGLAIIIGNRYGLDLSKEVAAVVDIVVTLLTIYLVYQVPNKESV